MRFRFNHVNNIINIINNIVKFGYVSLTGVWDMILNRTILGDESGQGAAEYILLFGGIIIIAIMALLLYKEYFKKGVPFNVGDDHNTVLTCAKSG